MPEHGLSLGQGYLSSRPRPDIYGPDIGVLTRGKESIERYTKPQPCQGVLSVCQCRASLILACSLSDVRCVV